MEKKCPKCGASNHFTESKCIDCGFVFNPPVIHQISDEEPPIFLSQQSKQSYTSSLKNLMTVFNTLFILILLSIILPAIYLLLTDFGIESFWYLIIAFIYSAIVCVAYYLLRLLLESYVVVVEASELYLKNNKDK